MSTPPKAQSLTDRRARQHRAEEAAIQELETLALKRREQSERLRRLRLSNDGALAQQFVKWRAREAKKAE